MIDFNNGPKNDCGTLTQDTPDTGVEKLNGSLPAAAPEQSSPGFPAHSTYNPGGKFDSVPVDPVYPAGSHNVRHGPTVATNRVDGHIGESTDGLTPQQRKRLERIFGPDNNDTPLVCRIGCDGESVMVFTDGVMTADGFFPWSNDKVNAAQVLEALEKMGIVRK